MKKNISTFILIFTGLSLTFSQVKLGEKVPNFTTIDQEGSKWVLKKNLNTSDYLIIYSKGDQR